MDQNKANPPINNNPQPLNNIDHPVDIPSPQNNQNVTTENQTVKSDSFVATTTPFTRRKSSRGKKLIATLLGILLLIGGVGTGVFLTQRSQNIREKAWFFPQDPPLGTQCPAFGGHTAEEIGTFQGDCLINYCPDGFETACSAGTTPGAWSEKKPCSQITTSLESQEYCVQIDYLSENGLYCNIGSPECDPNNPPLGGCGAKELSQLDLNGNGIPNEADDCIKTPRKSPPPNENIVFSCNGIEIYTVTGDLENPSNWRKLTTDEIANLKEGDVIYFVVDGSETSGYGSIDKAKFIINNQEYEGNRRNTGISCAAVVGSQCGISFYLEYTIPKDVYEFKVEAKLHHDQSDKWF